MRRIRLACAVAVGALALCAAGEASASSHREAPFITKMPKVDNTDFYMFRSYETGRDGFVTIIANYQPLQDAYGGPNYFSMDPDALYEIHIDNNGDAQEDLTFQFRFQNALAASGFDIQVAPGQDVNIPLIIANAAGGTAGGVTPFSLTTPRHVNETYGVKVVRGNRRTGMAADVTHTGGPGGNGASFVKPLDYVGVKAFNDTPGGPFTNYNNYANAHVYGKAGGTAVTIPGCNTAGSRVFVGQRRESFAVNLGRIFDLINAPLSGAGLLNAQGGTTNLYDIPSSGVGYKNITTIAVEVPIDCVRQSAAQQIIGGWATASVRQARVINPQATYGRPSREGGAWAQVSRLGSPLVNEVVIGLRDKDRFNSSEPKDDAQFLKYVQYPTLPKLIELLFGSANAPAPSGAAFPRADLVQAFLTGVTGVNSPPNVVPSEMLRLNLALPAIPVAQQFRGNAGGGGTGRGLGAAGCFVPAANTAMPRVLDASAGNLVTGGGTCDPSGFPNGRRPGDDVVDIALRVVMGYLLQSGTNPNAPAGLAPLGDGVQQVPTNEQFDNQFPYLYFPNPGSGLN